MRVLLIAFAAWLAAAPEAGTFYRYPQGTVWTYDADFAGARRRVTYTIAEVENERRHVEFDVFREGDPGATASDDLLWYEKDGLVLISHDEMDGTDVPSWSVWKTGAQPGDQWKGPNATESTFVGEEDVEVPAGKFERTVHVRVRADAVFDFWYAPGTGLVKSLRTEGEQKDSLVLRKVERP